jgi:Methane oxygenase PmoA
MFPFRQLRIVGALVLAGIALAGCALCRGVGTAQSGVTLTRTNNVVAVAIDGRPFTEYRYRDVSRPFLYPILGAHGEHFSRRWPQETVPGEEHDHPHHHALWWAHGDANGVDFWSEEKNAGRTVHQSFAELSSGREVGVLTSRNRWIAKDGKVIASDERTMRFHHPVGTERIVDFEITVFASNGDLTLGDTKEGSMALRLAESLRLTLPDKKPGAGHIVNSEGVRDGDTWGKRADWVDYSGPVDGRTVGVAIFDHPANPRHPTWWHVRDYGLFAANPFGLHDFEKREKGAGNLKIPAGQNVTFRYRFYFHDGDAAAAAVAAHYAQYLKAPK